MCVSKNEFQDAEYKLSGLIHVCVTHRFAAGLLQKLHRLLPLVLLVLLTHLQRGSLLLVLYVL